MPVRAFALCAILFSAARAAAAPAETVTVVARPAVPDTGSETAPTFGGGAVPVTAGGVLPSLGGEGIVQSAASLPDGFTDGTAPVASGVPAGRRAGLRLAHAAFAPRG